MHRRALKGQVAADLDPAVHQDRHVVRDRALDDRIDACVVAKGRDPQLDPTETQLFYATAQLAHRGLAVDGVHVAKADHVLGQTTQAAIADRFPTEPLGSVQLKGLSRKINIFRLAAEEIDLAKANT